MVALAGIFRVTVHLLKLCVGVETLSQLATYQEGRRARGVALTHTTRNRPRRADEVLAGGSLYWVIKGVIRARQPLIGLDDVSEQMGRKACQIVLGPELVRVRTRPCRAFQGWRYLEAAKAPDDLPAGSDDGEDLPPTMQKELRALGLL